jgi:xanthine dehydrogenase accessory factor
MDIYEEITRLRKNRQPCVVATIIQSLGSSPRKEGAKMLVKHDGSTTGTLGGGCMEKGVIELSLEAMKDGSAQTAEFKLTGTHGRLACGGKVVVFIEPILPDPRLVILGAGHVGKALATIAWFSGFRVTVIDDRDEFANGDNIPYAHDIVVNEFTEPFSGIEVGRDSYVIIATRGHDHDLDALKAVLGGEARYVGLVGSKHKRAVLFRALREAGFSDADTGRVTTPAGISIGSVTPEEIAISIMAQIIEQRRKNALPDLGHSSSGGIVQEDGTTQTASPAR